MKKLIFTLATVALLGGVFGQSSAAKAEVDITASFPLGGGVAYVAPPPVVYAPQIYAPVPVDYYHRHDDWRYRYYHRDFHHDWRDRYHRY